MTRIDTVGVACREEPTAKERRGNPETQRLEGQDAVVQTAAGASANRTVRNTGRSARAQRYWSEKGNC